MSNDPNDAAINWANTTSEPMIISAQNTTVTSNPLITSCTEGANSLIGHEIFTDHSKTQKK